MIPFSAPIDQILFSLEHVARVDRIPDWDAETCADVLGHFAQMAEEVIAPTNAEGDAKGTRLQDGAVKMPDGFHAAFAQLAEGGWQGLTAPEEHGGMGLSHVIAGGVSEVFSGANHSLQMVCNLVPGAISTLLRFGSVDQQKQWIPRLANGEVLSTMCLTEAQAGSDLSAVRTKATRTEGENWRIDGEKIFISGGDQDLSEDILHLVLARSGTPEDGLRGLSLFLCQKQPQAKVTRTEEKMGLHGSPTCTMVFDGAEAQLVGQEGAGLTAMFTLMNHARLDVALQGVAHASRAADLAQTYAEQRVQGRQPDKTPASLTDHADVQRMLARQQILAIGARAMCHIAMVELELGARPDLVEFMTPLCKVFGSEVGVTSADIGMQVMGGYGYLTEYGMEQIWRDARICAIYEGANGIHTRSLVTRGLRPDGGADAFANLIRELAQDEPRVMAWLEPWQHMRHQIEASDDPLPRARAFYDETTRLLLRAIWARIGQVATGEERFCDLKALSQRVLEQNEVAI